jgi:hypothetical protein
MAVHAQLKALEGGRIAAHDVARGIDVNLRVRLICHTGDTPRQVFFWLGAGSCA